MSNKRSKIDARRKQAAEAAQAKHNQEVASTEPDTVEPVGDAEGTPGVSTVEEVKEASKVQTEESPKTESPKAEAPVKEAPEEKSEEELTPLQKHEADMQRKTPSLKTLISSLDYYETRGRIGLTSKRSDLVATMRMLWNAVSSVYTSKDHAHVVAAHNIIINRFKQGGVYTLPYLSRAGSFPEDPKPLVPLEGRKLYAILSGLANEESYLNLSTVAQLCAKVGIYGAGLSIALNP